MTRIGLDVGGTFTDIVTLDGATGATSWLKVPTNQAAPSQGVLDAIAATGLDCAQLEGVRLGTTLAVNAILTRTGARVGLITTAGFRDVLAIRRTHRQSLFDLDERFPEPLVPRELRLEVAERLDADGGVVRPLDEDEVRRAARQLSDAGVEAVAIVFLFSFENPAHERRARELVVEEGGFGTVLISSDVLPAYREYERTSTTVAAAHLSATVDRHLRELGAELERRGLAPGRLSVMTNSGGTLSAPAAAELPISTLMSGPVGGVEAARWLAAEAGWERVLTLDMGGTSCDVSGIVDGVPDERLDMVVDGHTISYPTYDIETIGAGGGSIAWVDAGGALRVGPQSAGSDPGPACYGRGGELPTVTDADLVLGRYDPEAPLGGSVELDLEPARRAIATHVADPLGLGVEAAAAGILRIVNVLMTNAIRVISVERGRDVRAFTLVAYGGAGPAHAAELALELGIPRVLVPPFPGCTSAFGAAIAGSRRDFVQTIARPVEALDRAALADLLAELRAAATAGLEAEGFVAGDQVVETWLDLRYRGQAHELSVRAEGAELDAASLAAAVEGFHRMHEQLYGHAFADVPVELVNLHVKGLARRDDPALWWNWRPALPEAATLAPSRPVYFQTLDEFVSARVLVREALDSGERVEGPAVIHQLDSTVVVPHGFVAETLPGGSLMLEVVEPRAEPAPGFEVATAPRGQREVAT